MATVRLRSQVGPISLGCMPGCLTHVVIDQGLSDASEPDVRIGHKRNQLRAAVRAQDQHFASAPNWLPKHSSRGRLASRLAIRQLPAASVLTACSSCFSAVVAAQPLRPSSQLGGRYTSGAGAYEKGAEVGSEAAFSESAAEPSMAGVRA